MRTRGTQCEISRWRFGDNHTAVINISSDVIQRAVCRGGTCQAAAQLALDGRGGHGGGGGGGTDRRAPGRQAPCRAARRDRDAARAPVGGAGGDGPGASRSAGGAGTVGCGDRGRVGASDLLIYEQHGSTDVGRMYFQSWGLGDPFINLAAGHHKPETSMQWIIAMADRTSSGFDRDEFEDYNKEIGFQDYKKTRLLTIFEGISILKTTFCRKYNN